LAPFNKYIKILYSKFSRLCTECDRQFDSAWVRWTDGATLSIYVVQHHQETLVTVAEVKDISCQSHDCHSNCSGIYIASGKS